MAEVFKPRENMIYDGRYWECRDEKYQLTCDGGPSIITTDGDWEFIESHMGRHRIEGPANSFGHWYINNNLVTREIHDFAKENNINLKNLSDVDKVLIALRFG